jgi:serine/threonine protein phosphatase PrpC
MKWIPRQNQRVDRVGGQASIVRCQDIAAPVAIGTARGRVRKKQEDAIGVVSTPNRLVVIVCDGMGGMRDGQWCATTARRSAASSILAGADLADACLAANRAVLKRMRGSGGTTIVLAEMLRDGSAVIAHAGDSRGHVLVDDKVIVTQDHAIKGWGLTNFIGSKEPHVDKVKFPPGWSMIVLTTDGIHELVNVPDAMAEPQPAEPESLAKRMIEEALARGGHDNATTAVILPARETATQTTLWNCEDSFVWE